MPIASLPYYYGNEAEQYAFYRIPNMKHPNIRLTEDGGARPYIHKRKEVDYQLADLPYEVTALDDLVFIEVE